MERVFRQECSSEVSGYIDILLPEITKMLSAPPSFGTRAINITYNDQEITKITVDSSEVILIDNRKRKEKKK